MFSISETSTKAKLAGSDFLPQYTNAHCSDNARISFFFFSGKISQTNVLIISLCLSVVDIGT
jgi:hypothetical protein